jgi:hypothetical protein
MPKSTIADLQTAALIHLISAAEPAPGAGAAGAITLALAAACGAKAASVSLKHSPGDARLSASLAQFEALCDGALRGADSDSHAFRDFLRNKTVKTARELVEAGELLAHLIEGLFLAIEEIEPHVTRAVAGDLLAARALATAARTIQSANESEAIAAERFRLDRYHDS